VKMGTNMTRAKKIKFLYCQSNNRQSVLVTKHDTGQTKISFIGDRLFTYLGQLCSRNITSAKWRNVCIDARHTVFLYWIWARRCLAPTELICAFDLKLHPYCVKYALEI